jgi:hemoglobin/transferrin/lactoferrin receptor protein
MTPLFFVLLLLTTTATAQSLTGTVREAGSRVPLTNVTVRLQKQITKTDALGRFAFANLSSGDDTLRLSSVGYESVNQVVAGQSNVIIELMPGVIRLNRQVVVTAPRAEATDYLRSEAVSVLSARELADRAPRSVPEVLTGAAGVYVQKTNHGGGSPFVRGLTGQQTLLLVDGIRLSNATTRSGPNQYLNTIDPQSVNQIEVVRSTGSVAYGSDAIGGVVNVLTRNPQFADKPMPTANIYTKWMSGGMEQSVRAEAGYSTSRVAVLAGAAWRNFGDLIGGANVGRQSPTGYRQWSGDVKARVRLADRHLLTLAYQHLQQDSVPIYHRVRLENYRYFQFDPQRRQLAYARLDSYFGRRWVDQVLLTASFHDQTEGRQSQRNNNITAIYERDQTQTTGLSALVLSRPAAGWQVQSGVEFYGDFVRSERQDVNTATGAAISKRGLYPDRATMSSLAIFSLHTYTHNRLTLTAGGRYNAFSVTIPADVAGRDATIRPSALVGNAGISFAVLPALRIVGGVQSAFRAPNVDDLGTLGIVDFRYETPNATLRPEQSVNVEAGLKISTGRVSAVLTGYQNKLTDLIGRVRVGKDSVQGYPLYQKENIAGAFIRGIEAEAEWQLSQPGAPASWLLSGNLTYTYGQNETAGEPLRRIPPLFGRLHLTWRNTNGWHARAEWLVADAQTRLAKGDVDDNRIGAGGTAGWHVFNTLAGYRRGGFSINAEAQNLSNATYKTHGSGVWGVGRSVWIAVSYRL